jgi:hypothetical protein
MNYEMKEMLCKTDKQKTKLCVNCKMKDEIFKSELLIITHFLPTGLSESQKSLLPIYEKIISYQSISQNAGR